MAFVSALALTFALLGGLAVSFSGWGRVLRAALKIPPPPSDAALADIWIGWAATLAIFQFAHLFAPLRAWVVVPVFVLGIALFFRQRPAATIVAAAVPPRRAASIPTIACIGFGLIAAAWIAMHAMQTPLDFDAGLYHFHAIRWINEARITPGLGNLHGRLAFNNSFFVYVAALNFEPLFSHGRSLANTFLFLVVLGGILARLRHVWGRREAWNEHGGFACAADLLVLPLLLFLALSSLGFASPSADLASALLQIAMFLLLVHGLGEWQAGQRGQDGRVFTLALLAVAAVTLKLSNLGFGAGVLLLCALGASPALRRPLALACFASGAIWIVRGYILSGYPFYPSAVGGAAFDWTVPMAQANFDADGIRAWARQPWDPASRVLADSRWLGPWLYRARNNFEGIVYPFLVTLLCMIAAVVLRRSVKAGPPARILASVLGFLPLATGLIFWFCTAPDPRFAHALIWLLAAGAALGFLAAAQRANSRPLPIAAVLAIALLANAHFFRWAALHRDRWREVSLTGWEPVLPAGYTPRKTESGLIVNTYQYRPDELIWDGPRPATPDFNPRLRLRVPDHPEFGFTAR